MFDFLWHRTRTSSFNRWVYQENNDWMNWKVCNSLFQFTTSSLIYCSCGCFFLSHTYLRCISITIKRKKIHHHADYISVVSISTITHASSCKPSHHTCILFIRPPTLPTVTNMHPPLRPAHADLSNHERTATKIEKQNSKTSTGPPLMKRGQFRLLFSFCSKRRKRQLCGVGTDNVW